MIHKNDITVLFKNCLWERLASLYAPIIVVESLSFKDSLRLAYRLLYNDNWDENFQQYAIQLLYKLRNDYPSEWSESWEYDALIGLACDITSKHEERYDAYKRAFDRANNPPPRLLIELARCCICPGYPPISYEQAIALVQQALKVAPYSDGISLLCNIYSMKEDDEKKDYWSKILRESNEKLNSPSIEPKFLVDEYLHDKKEKNGT